MTHVRYLMPFSIFLALFLISGAVAYFFYNEKMTLEADITRINNTELKQGFVYNDAVDLQGENALLAEPLGYYRSQEESDDAVAHTDGTIDVNTYIDSIRRELMWMRGQTRRVRRFNHAKSQHQLDYLGTSALSPDQQLSKARELYAQVDQTLQSSIDFVTTDTGQPGSGVLADNPALLADDQEFFRAVRRSLENQRGDIRQRIDEIKGYLDDIQPKVADAPVRGQAQDDIRGLYAQAAKAADELVHLLSYTRIDGSEVAIPGLIDSPVKRFAVQLSHHLDPNDLEYLRRPEKSASEGDDTVAYVTAVLKDAKGEKAKDIAFRALMADNYQVSSQRNYFTSPYYLGGISLEEVSDNQDMLINSLQHMNHLLADRLMVALSIYHREDARILRDGDNSRRAGAWRGTIVELRENYNSGGNEFPKGIREIAGDVEGSVESMGESEQRLSGRRVEDQIFEAQEDILTQHRYFLNGERDKISADMRRYEDAVFKLQELFLEIKQSAIRNEGTLKLSGSDGQIVWRDNVDKLYHINLGKNDHIRRGMRFLVYSDRGGESIVKGLIEVTRISSHNFATCRLVVKFDNEPDATGSAPEIVVGDNIENRLYHKGRYLQVACVGDFRPPNTTVSFEQVRQYLLELGCKVQEGPDTNTELVILAQPAENMIPLDADIRNFLQLRQRVKLDEVQVNELMIYFEDQ